MNKLVVASTLLAAGALTLAAAAAAWPAMRRYLLCAYFVGSANLFDVNFVSHEQYRGWVRGFEIGSQDVLVFALLVSVLAGAARHPLRLLPALALPILAWLALALLSAVTAEVPLYAAFGLLKLARYTIAFWVIANAVRDEGDLRWLLWTFVACAGWESFDAVKDYFKGTYRVRGSFDHPNTLGMYLNMLVPFVLAALLNLRTRWTALLFGVFGLAAGAIVLTLSRGSWVSLGLAIALVLPISLVLRLRPRKLGLLALMFLLALPPGIFAAQKMARRIREAPASSGEARVEFNQVARQMAHDRAFGIGLNNFSFGTDGPYSEPFEGGLDRGGLCHNLYFLSAGELGWGGLGALLLVFATAFGRSARFLARNLGEDLRSVMMLALLASLATVALQSTLEWALLQTGLATTFFGLLALVPAIERLRAGSRVTRYRVSIRTPAAAGAFAHGA
ncbi:MAG: O-antigen ligase family protein [Thermoanaerobaculia bacterium]|nr:O-antigen ligase family protein [Thermoanaerobaculia bacterium]MBP9823673.1 O-antigen ligase family protein [Thermoanaerobaculia bacterium]